MVLKFVIIICSFYIGMVVEFEIYKYIFRVFINLLSCLEIEFN